MDTRVGSERERVAPWWYFESLLWGISFQFTLTNHLALFGKDAIFGIAQGHPVYVYIF